jgi:predicted ATP-dependent protease
MSDILTEAGETARSAGALEITQQAVLAALNARRRRNARSEDRIHEEIARGVVLIDTQGRAVGQINALVVHDLRDHAFGLPVRVTARSSVGRSGLVNIERDVTLGGPIQQKAVMVIQGFLAGHFARNRPLSFNCSLTFEQSYGGVEGDSASVAELLAVLSDLSGMPIRQDIAVTGSINQVGVVQAVGGVSHKIEGFYRVCDKAGPFTGTQGVLVPASNRQNVVLVPEVSAAIAAGHFHVWTAETVEDAIELMIGAPAGAADDQGQYPEGTVFHAVARQLDRFNAILTRAGLGAAAVN